MDGIPGLNKAMRQVADSNYNQPLSYTYVETAEL